MSAPTAKLSFEIAQLRRLKFGKKSEQLDSEQRALFDEALDADLAAAEAQLQELLGKKKPPATPGAMPKRTALSADLPRVDCHHDP
ncbi:transposase, partial [Acinetobacter baumannii]